MSVSWNPWHGCLRVSEGCRHCYVYRQDAAWEKDGSIVRRNAAFNLPVRRRRDGRWKIPAGEMVYTCFTSDFLLAEADEWRPQAWEMMRLRPDLQFMFFTKRIERMVDCLPPDWGAEGYPNVWVGCTVENQAMADRRLPVFAQLPIHHKSIICAPLIGPLDLSAYLTPEIEEVSVGGESGTEALSTHFSIKWELLGFNTNLKKQSDRCTPAQGRACVAHPAAVPTHSGTQGGAQFPHLPLKVTRRVTLVSNLCNPL